MKILTVTYPNSRAEYINKIIKEEVNNYDKPLNVKKIINEEINNILTLCNLTMR